MNRVVLTEYNGDQMSREMCVAKIKKEKPRGRDSNAHHKRLQSETKKREKRGVPTDHREEHKKEYQFDSEKALKGTIVHTSKSEQDQATRMPDEEVITNGKTRKGEERVQRNPCHWRSWQETPTTVFFFQELWFQQDGATCHTARATIDLLKDTFGYRLISRFGLVNWPPRSCDLIPLDYFLWGYVKSLVYADTPQTLDHLEDNIRCVIADIRPQMLEKVIENWTSRLDYIRASRGSPMPEIIFKISFAIPTPLAHANALRDVLPKGGTSQNTPKCITLTHVRRYKWHPTWGRFTSQKAFEDS
ncbi:uncharacterized protein TNCV_82651 [Trichonephila clavipes]|nr:uncharacterized protein TNCV_82651 [Trichonephila clavipes]